MSPETRMSLIEFPDLLNSSCLDIVTLGGSINTHNLLEAYRRGIFPWPIEGWPMTWFCPQRRAILKFKDLHVPRRLARSLRQTTLHCTIDEDFEGVINHCADVERPGQDGTWITGQMVRAYCELHRLGHAHSVEVWDEEGNLVGGLYGVDADGSFAGESMFHLRANASKLALLHLVAHLLGRGLDWIDIQMMTPHMEAFGAREMSRDEFLLKLAATRARRLKLFD
jgi:leucyl/phenylalanyl-tRNA--protein transferase